MPAFVKSRVGSPCGTSDELGTLRWPLDSKNRKKISRISLAARVMQTSGERVSAVRVAAARRSSEASWRAIGVRARDDRTVFDP
jgi:hypothetical protein